MLSSNIDLTQVDLPVESLHEGTEKWMNLIPYFVQYVHPSQAYGKLVALIIEAVKASSGVFFVKSQQSQEWKIRCSQPDLDISSFPVDIRFLDKVIEKKSPFWKEGYLLFPIYDQGKNLFSVLALKWQKGEENISEGSYYKKVEQVAVFLKVVLIQEITIEEDSMDAEIRNLSIFVGNHEGMLQVYRDIKKVAKSECTVSVYGETGTGKELVAQALHHLSDRRDKPLIAVNCATIPKELAESELFGHEKGSFSSAVSTKMGKFELAKGGTLFLDEIGELPGEIQSKLLRVLQEKELWRVGGQKTIPVNVRLIVATHQNLEQEVQKKNFRADLFYRINVFPIYLNPLRERGRDITLLAYYFLKESAPHIPGFHPEVLREFQHQRWPGNVRQLKHCIERGILYYRGKGPLSMEEMFMPQDRFVKSVPSKPPTTGQVTSLDYKIKEVIRESLFRNEFNKSKTAKELKITRPRLDRLIKKYHLQLS